MKKLPVRIGIAAAILSSLLSASVVTHARTFKVSRTSSLIRAVEKAGEGDTIVLRKGVYRLDETLTIEGKTGLVIRGDRACLNGGVRIPLRRLRRVSQKDGDFAKG
ncbi:MAG: hypothetical protein IJJ96_08040, partial [Bacteroidales bacterium]|nr:hypothetical protein [Bacteroidales bacterium]